MVRFVSRVIIFLGGSLLATASVAAIYLSKPTEWGARKFTVTAETLDEQSKVLPKTTLNKMIKLRISVKSLDGNDLSGMKLVKFDAEMPAHRHGMITKPRVQEVTTSEYLIEGVKFHMPGQWQLKFDFKAGHDALQVAIPLNL